MVLLFDGGGAENTDYAKLVANLKPRGHAEGERFYGCLGSVLVCQASWAWTHNGEERDRIGKREQTIFDEHKAFAKAAAPVASHAILPELLAHAPPTVCGFYQYYDVDVYNEGGELVESRFCYSNSGKTMMWDVANNIVQPSAIVPVYNNSTVDEALQAGRVLSFEAVVAATGLTGSVISQHLGLYFSAGEAGVTIAQLKTCVKAAPDGSVHKFARNGAGGASCCIGGRPGLMKCIVNCRMQSYDM